MDEIKRHLELKGISQRELARRLKLNRSTVSMWFHNGQIPAERVLAVEMASGVPRAILRPDLYPNEHTDVRKAAQTGSE